MKSFLFILAFVAAPAWALKLEVRSNPEKAEVRMRLLNSVELKKIGETPLETTVEEFVRSYAEGQDAVILEVFKPGHEPYRMTMPLFLKSDFMLDVNLEKKSGYDEIKKIDGAIAELFEAQRMIRSQNYDAAITKLQALEKTFPNTSVAKELLGAAHYLKKDFKAALDFYQQAVSANTDNLDAAKMVQYLEKTMGLKKAGDPAVRQQ